MNPLSERDGIGKLPPGRHKHLCRLLMIGDAWISLAEVIPNRKRTGCKFNGDDIELIRRNRDPADELLRRWRTDNVTIGDLIRCLKEAELLRQAAYVSQILQPTETVFVEVPVQVRTSEQTSTALLCMPMGGQDAISAEYGLQIPSLPLNSLVAWTQRFDARSVEQGGCLIGRGGYADVFRGTDESGKMVAIKKFRDDSTSCRRQFENEINVQMKCHHKNVVSLIGYCYSPTVCCLVYQYMCNGSLEEFLEGKGGRPALTVPQRLLIAKDVAHGIAHLIENNLIHRDIKSANILLDDAMRAKLGDFGITRSGPSTPLSTSTATMVLIGTTPYMAPEYLLNGRLSFKTDSFSFGVNLIYEEQVLKIAKPVFVQVTVVGEVLLEILTGLRAYDSQREECTLLEHVKETYDERNFRAMADAKAGEWNEEITRKIYNMSMLLCGKEKTRPDVSSVLEDIDSWC